MLALQEVLARFASWLFSLRDGNDIETAFESTWSVAPWLPWSIFAAILMVVLLCYRRVPGGIARRTRILLVVCRSLLVLLVLWMMYGFAMRPYRTDLPDVVLLVDDSTSMSIVDNWSDADRRQQVEALMKSIDVNWEPWSVFIISGLPYRHIASFKASRHGPASSVTDKRHASTLRLNHSTTATR